MRGMRRDHSIHQNLPAQFRRMMRCLRTRAEVEPVALDDEAGPPNRPRVQVPGKRPYASYRTVLQVPSLHIYLSYPLALSTVSRDHDAESAGRPACPVPPEPIQPLAHEGDR